MKNVIHKYFAEIGRRGGRKSRRTLNSKTARNMVCIREAKRAYQYFYASCFWSYDPKYQIKMTDIPWVAKELMKNGGRKAWEAGARLCH